MSTPDLPDTVPQAPKQESLIEYPSQFPIKVMGAHVESFMPEMVALAQQ